MKKITFATDNKYLLDFPELYPQPARNFVPEWYTKVPVNKKNPNANYTPKKIKILENGSGKHHL